MGFSTETVIETGLASAAIWPRSSSTVDPVRRTASTLVSPPRPMVFARHDLEIVRRRLGRDDRCEPRLLSRRDRDLELVLVVLQRADGGAVAAWRLSQAQPNPRPGSSNALSSPTRRPLIALMPRACRFAAHCSKARALRVTRVDRRIAAADDDQIASERAACVDGAAGAHPGLEPVIPAQALGGNRRGEELLVGSGSRKRDAL